MGDTGAEVANTITALDKSPGSCRNVIMLGLAELIKYLNLDFTENVVQQFEHIKPFPPDFIPDSKLMLKPNQEAIEKLPPKIV